MNKIAKNLAFEPRILRLAKPVQELMLKMVSVPPDVRASVHGIEVMNQDDRRKITTDIYEPEHEEKMLPCILYIHGGGFGYKAAPYHKQLAAVYVQRVHCRVVMPDYRLLPEHPFPAGLEDVITVYRWLTGNAQQLKIDPGKIAVAGDSAGGALAACLCNRYEQEKLIKPCLQMLFYPVTDVRMKTDSMRKYPDTPLWNSVNNAAMWEMYLQNCSQEDKRKASPMQNELPEEIVPAYVEVAEFDCLHDEGAAYADRLKDAGGSVMLIDTKGTIHGYDGALESHTTRKCMEKRTAVLQKVFS
ncbi:MAG: alpha/beta hydrolase [Butyrivibrio sp.]|jgi:acetyl esterase|nr:alpha/beta hydrolase [Butyrivibrio sp.]